jgi:hypothetical protein
MENIHQKLKMKTEYKKITCFSHIIENLDNLEKIGLFSPERMKEIRDYLADDKFGEPKLEGGKHIVGWVIHFDSGLMWSDDMFNRKSGKFYIHTRILEKYLSDDEINKLNSYADSLWQERNEENRFNTAKKLSENEWGGRVFWNDNYYESVDEFKEMYFDDGNDLPEYVWAVDEETPVINFDIHDILERFTEDAYEGFDSNDLNGLKEFEDAIEKFKEANTDFKSLNSSCKIAVILNKK